jgi:pyruvate/2-oxoacid:ferredoxin oxidoreductase alpha subunit
MQLYCSGAQEIFDTVLQAYLLSEKLLLPCMVVFDGFYISHTYETVDIPEKEKVREFIGPPIFAAQVCPGEPANIHGIISGDKYHELFRKRHETMMEASREFKTINELYKKQFNRCYGVIDSIIPDGADTVVFTAGAVAETVTWLLPKIAPAGLIKLKMFRPFPEAELRCLLKEKKIKNIIVVDRNCSAGAGGIFARELKAALYSFKEKPAVYELILAGGIDLSERLLTAVLERVSAGDAENRVWGGQIK